MATEALLALRFPQQFGRFYNVISGFTTETLDGNVHLKTTAFAAMYAAPRRYSDVVKVIFWASVRNVDATVDFSGRLRTFPSSASDDPAIPNIVDVADESRLNAGVSFPIAAIINKRYSKPGETTALLANMSSGSSGILVQEFNVFDASSADFFAGWNSAVGVNDFIEFNFSLEILPGSTQAVQLFDWGFTVIQAPSPSNDTTSYVQIWPGQQQNASGPTTLDRLDPATTDQIRGAWRWIYDASEWDGIVGIHLVLYYGTGTNTSGMTLEAQLLTAEQQIGNSTTTLTAETYAAGANEYGIIRSKNLLSLLTDGDILVGDWRQDGVALPGTTGAQGTIVLEIIQRNCTKTVSFFHVMPAVTRAHNGLNIGETTTLWGSGSHIDPQWFANYPDSLFTKRKSIGSIVHENFGNDPEVQIWMNSNLTEEQVGPSFGITPTTTQVARHTATPIADVPRWTYQEFDILLDPLNFAGKRRLMYVMSIALEGEHPGMLCLKYAYAVPNTEFLELGPLFPVGEFNPEGCASTSAGLGDPGILVITNGSTIPKKFDPVANLIEDNGVPVPFEGEFPSGAALVVNSFPFSPNGGIVPGRYEYRYTFRNCCTGKESDPNPDTFVVDSAAAGASPGASHSISFVGIRIPSDPQICEICLYRTVAGGAFPVMAKVGCIDIDTTTLFVDTVPDALLDFMVDPLAVLNAPMPCVPLVVGYQNRLFGAGDIPQLAPTGTVSVVLGSVIVTGSDDVDWDRCLEGKFIKVGNDCRIYEIERILPPVSGSSPAVGRLKLIEEYEGVTDTGLSYQICGHQNRLFFSEPLEPECWPNLNFLDIEPGDGDKIMGMVSNFGSLVICKRNRTYLLRFRDNPLLEVNVPQRISTDIGSIAPRSFAQVENGSVWLSDRGLALFDGRGVQHIPASDRFNDMLINPDNPLYIRRDGQGRVIDAVGVFYPKREQYLLLLPTVETVRGANVMLVWDTSLDNITLYKFCQEFQSMVVAKDSDGNQRVYMGDTNGFVWMLDIGDTDGVGFPNATGTVKGTVSGAGLSDGASFLDDSSATFLLGGLPQLALLSGVQGLTPAFSSTSPDASSELGLAGVCMFTRAAGAALDAPWTERIVYAATETRLFVTPGWGTETPAVGDDYMIGPIDFVARFKPRNYGTDDEQKRNWKQVLTYVPEQFSTSLRIELLPDFAETDDEELTIDGGEGRTFDLSFARGRLTRPVGRSIHNYMQVVMKNFEPEAPVRILNHALAATPRTQ